MHLHIWITFLLASVVLSVSPGAGAVNTMSNALSHGVRRTLPAILGLQAGLAATIALVGLGLGAAVAASATAFTVIKWAGVAYLIWLGWKKWNGATHFAVAERHVAPPAALTLFGQATLVNLTNPKSIVFLVALFPQFIDPALAQGPQVLIMGTTLVLVDIVVMVGYATLAARLRPFVQDPRRMQVANRAFGGLFIGAGALLAGVRHQPA